MAAKLQTMRSGGTQHPEEIVNFMMSQLVSVPGVYDLAASKLLVTQETVPAMSVKVAQGAAFLKASGALMAYPGILTDADASVAISSNSSGNPRKNAIVLYVDKGATPNPDITNVLKLVAIAGTPAGSPVSPSDATIQAAIGSANPFLRLADVTVASGAVSILNASILDTRVEVKFKVQIADPTLAQQPASKNYVDRLTHAATGKTTPVDADEMPLQDSAASFALKKLTWANLKATLLAYLQGVASNLLKSWDGWQTVSDAWTYSGADAPTFTITVPSGAASLYTVGQRIRLTQTTVKYFIITAVADTVLTVYGGTDYTLANAAISAISISSQKAPLGFPMDPLKWSITTTGIVCSQSNPTQNQYYSPMNFYVPIGAWKVQLEGGIYSERASLGVSEIYAGIGTANNNFNLMRLNLALWSVNGGIHAEFSRQVFVALATKTQYFLVMQTAQTGITTISIGNTNSATLRIVCAYL